MDKKHAIPVWVWEMRSKTLAFLKKRGALKESFNEYLNQKLTPKTLNIERFLDVFSTAKH